MTERADTGLTEEDLREITQEMQEKREQAEGRAMPDYTPGSAVDTIRAFDMTPRDVKEYLDQYVIGQEEGKKAVSVRVAFHYKRLSDAIHEEDGWIREDIDAALEEARTPDANLLIVGPSGTGKTYTAETVSDLVGVPFVKKDMTDFSETGYVGDDVNTILRDLYREADGDPHLAQMGIVYLDEIDKIAEAPYTVGRDVSGKGVQDTLLKLVEGVETTIETQDGAVPMSTEHTLFIASGAFEGLDEIVEERLAEEGVDADVSWRDHIDTEDLIDYGMERQLVGRFPARVPYRALEADDLRRILQYSEDSPRKAYERDMAAWDIDLLVTDGAAQAMADHAIEEGTGARGLVSVMDRVLRDDMYAKPGRYTGKLRVDREYVEERLNDDG